KRRRSPAHDVQGAPHANGRTWRQTGLSYSRAFGIARPYCPFMSLESVRAFFAENAPDITVIESPISSATVALAAEAYGVEPGRIAKTLSLRIGERVVLIVASGTAGMDNKKVKALFGCKPKMLGVHEVAEITG